MEIERTAGQVAEKTGLSQKQIIRFAKASAIPGSRFVQGKGPGTGFKFRQSPELEDWIGRHKVCETMRGSVGRKGRMGYESFVNALNASAEQIRYEQTWDSIIGAITYLSRQLPKKIRKMMSLRGCSFSQVAALQHAMSPILNLMEGDVKVKLDQLRKSNRKW